MATGSLVPAIAGLAVGIAFVIAFALLEAGSSTTILTSNAQNKTFFTSPPDSIIIENEDDVDGCCSEISNVTLGHNTRDDESNTGVFVPDTTGDELGGGNFGLGENGKIELTIDGIKNTYRPGEHIIFSVSAKGTSDNACNIVSPSVDFRDDSDGKMMFWPHPFGLYYSDGCPKESQIDKVWTFGDKAEEEIILDSGSYTVFASIEGITVEKQFTVTS